MSDGLVHNPADGLRRLEDVLGLDSELVLQNLANIDVFFGPEDEELGRNRNFKDIFVSHAGGEKTFLQRDDIENSIVCVGEEFGVEIGAEVRFEEKLIELLVDALQKFEAVQDEYLDGDVGEVELDLVMWTDPNGDTNFIMPAWVRREPEE